MDNRGKKLEYSDYHDCFDYNEKPLYDLNEATPNFKGNVFIIQKGLGVLKHEEPSEYGQILEKTKISFEDLEITKYEI
jgi:hypothetical protein